MLANNLYRTLGNICRSRSLMIFKHDIPSLVNRHAPLLYAGLHTDLKLVQTTQKPETTDLSAEQKNTCEILAKVNQQLNENTQGRLFAVVHVAGKQFKVVAGDIIIVEGYWPPENGDEIRLDKILLAGGTDFSLIGRPLVQRGLVNVKATVIEKTLSHTRTHFRKKRRKQYMRINFYRCQHTMLRINSVEIEGQVDKFDEDPVIRIF